jgi:hypothetical protein
MDTSTLDEKQKEYINLAREEVLVQKRAMVGGGIGGMGGGGIGGMGGIGGFGATMGGMGGMGGFGATMEAMGGINAIVIVIPTSRVLMSLLPLLRRRRAAPRMKKIGPSAGQLRLGRCAPPLR